MESAFASRLFKQLFSHRPCSACSRHASASTTRLYSSVPTRRARARDAKETSSIESNWQQRSDYFAPEKAEEFKKYPLVTADGLRGRLERPKRARMLMRDFIEGVCHDSTKAVSPTVAYNTCRQLVQSKLRLFFQTGRYLDSW